ncbi:MAG TPA: hypothetical protein VE525_04130 [Rubrobacter sp.]|nr:hypothetical protein [Rubrobacter sp.]
MTVIAPAASSFGGAEGSVLSGSSGASSTPSIPTGTVAKNTHSQPGHWARKPPKIQPEAPLRGRPEAHGQAASLALRIGAGQDRKCGRRDERRAKLLRRARSHQ